MLTIFSNPSPHLPTLMSTVAPFRFFLLFRDIYPINEHYYETLPLTQTYHAFVSRFESDFRISLF